MTIQSSFSAPCSHLEDVKARKRERVRCSSRVDWPVLFALDAHYAGLVALTQTACGHAVVGSERQRLEQPHWT